MNPATCTSPRTHSPTAAAPRPLFSILTPSFNQGCFLATNLRSVATQRPDGVEHVVVDNASTDETRAILAAMPHVRWLSEPDRGQSHALNKALALARGEIIGWINADDAYERGALDAVLRRFNAVDRPLIVAGGVRHVDIDGRELGVFRPKPRELDQMVAFWTGGYGFEQPGVFVRRELLDRIGGLDESLHYVMDYDLLLRARAAAPIAIVDAVVARFVEHDASKTGRERHGDAFVDELQRVSKGWWGAPSSPRYKRLSRGCRRYLADHYANALWRSLRDSKSIDVDALHKMLRCRPALALRPCIARVLLAAAPRLLACLFKSWSTPPSHTRPPRRALEEGPS